MNRKGFTMIELIMVIVIIGVLSAVAIPKFINLKKDAEKAACDANVGAINSAVANYYARRALTGTAAFPTTLHVGCLVTSYLASQTLPVCAISTDYNDLYNATTGVVRKHLHP